MMGDRFVMQESLLYEFRLEAYTLFTFERPFALLGRSRCGPTPMLFCWCFSGDDRFRLRLFQGPGYDDDGQIGAALAQQGRLQPPHPACVQHIVPPMSLGECGDDDGDRAVRVPFLGVHDEVQ